MAKFQKGEGQGLVETEKYLAHTLLGEQSFKKINKALSSRWDRMHSLSAAFKLMNSHGVVLSPEEEQRLAKMEESQQINALVTKMPQQSNEQFQQFFLQLQLLVSAAARIRKSLEDGKPDQVEEAIGDAEATGISQYILRMAVVQSGSEVSNLRQQQSTFMKETNTKCSKLIRGQEDALNAQKRLAAVQAQLNQHNESHSKKTRKVIMSFSQKSEQALFSLSFNAWKTHVKQAKFESAIRVDYAERLDESERRLGEFKEAQLANARGVLMKKGIANDKELLGEVMSVWSGDVAEQKWTRANADHLADMEERLASLQGSQAEKTKKVMMRISNDNNAALVLAAWQAFVAFHNDYKKDKEYEDHVEEIEKQVNNFAKNKSAGAKKMLNKMSGHTNSGLILVCWTGWKELYEDKKREAELEAIVAESNLKMGGFCTNCKQSGMTAMERAAKIVEESIKLQAFAYWKLDAHAEGTLHKFQDKMEGKRSQLLGVQQMFRQFAAQLESTFQAGLESSRDLRDGPTPGRRMRKGGAGTVSLPDIHQGKASGRSASDVYHGVQLSSGRYDSRRQGSTAGSRPKPKSDRSGRAHEEVPKPKPKKGGSEVSSPEELKMKVREQMIKGVRDHKLSSE